MCKQLHVAWRILLHEKSAGSMKESKLVTSYISCDGVYTWSGRIDYSYRQQLCSNFSFMKNVKSCNAQDGIEAEQCRTTAKQLEIGV